MATRQRKAAPAKSGTKRKNKNKPATRKTKPTGARFMVGGTGGTTSVGGPLPELHPVTGEPLAPPPPDEIKNGTT